MYCASDLAPMLWSFPLFGAAVTIGFGYVRGTKHAWMHALACAAPTALIGFLLLIVSLQYPFTGPASVTTAPSERAKRTQIRSNGRIPGRVCR